MLSYILQTILFQLLFLICYDLFHKKDTFFNINRGYLLLTSAISLILPFIKVKTIQDNIPEQYIMELPTVFLNTTPAQASYVIKLKHTAESTSSMFDNINWWLVIYLVGVVFMLFRFLKRLIYLKKLRKTAIANITEKYIIYYLPNSRDAFSFWKTIYLGDSIDPKEKEQILTHELVHLEQLHTADHLWFEILKIIFWFNPLVYLYQTKITTLHEYIADFKSVSILGKKKYYQQLLAIVFDAKDIEFINQFFKKSLIKKRIQMLQKSKSKEIVKIKYLAVVPVLLAMVTFSSFSNKEVSKKFTNTLIQVQENDSIDTVLKKKFEKELSQMIINKASLEELRNKVSLRNKNGNISRESYIRSQVFMRHIVQQNISSKKNNNQLSAQEEEDAQQFLKQLNRSYDQFMKDNKNRPSTSDNNISSQKEVPFGQIDKVPAMQSCEDVVENTKRKQCVSEEINNFVNSNFNIDAIKPYAAQGINRIYARFKIDTTGAVANLQVRGSSKELENEARRVISLLPKMTPGEDDGEKVTVLYSFPIVFNIASSDESKPVSNNNLAVKDRITRFEDFTEEENECLNAASLSQKSLDNYLKITTDEREVIIHLVAIENDKVIRKAHIKKRNTYLLKNIPEDIYRIDISFGKEYEQQIINGICTGAFKKETIFEKGTDRLNFHSVRTNDGKIVLPSYSYSVESKKDKTDNSQEEEKVLTDQLSDIKGHSIEMGYYLITNIFKHDDYFRKGVKKLQQIGLQPQHFKNPKDGYIYVYLAKYNTLQDAKVKLKSAFDGQFDGDMYILKIK